MAKKRSASKRQQGAGTGRRAGGSIGSGGETHQTASGDEVLTTNQGTPVSDDQNTLTVGPRGPQLLEDFALREKITHFDHERIPERVVHARGFGAHGTFEAFDGNEDLTRAAFLQRGARTPVFVRFSTVAGSEGSPDTARDVRGFAVKFYTSEGNYDLVGNNIPVFFIQDAIKFPDLIHSVKPAPDRGFPQAQSAHDSFWDFVSLSPESTHMLMWVMSDRAIPRSFRMMEGFGVHTFRMLDARGKATFVKFHWRPKLGIFSLVWDEAVKLAGADPDFHRRDLWGAIERGEHPEWELSVQAFSEGKAQSFGFDVLDPTKLIPEELVPLRPIGRMVLDHNVNNFFAETEQVAFCPSHLVPGIDFSNDPLLQGRLFSYLDTQLSRLGSPNFHQLPINRPHVPVRNFQRDAHMQMEVPKGRVANEPNSLDEGAPREDPESGFRSFPAEESGQKLRARPESFADHYTQARLFYRSMTEPEQRHILAAFAFELGKVDAVEVRERMLGNLHHVDAELAAGVASRLGMRGRVQPSKAAVPPRDTKPSRPLSQYADAPKTLAGKTIGLLATDGAPARVVNALRKAAKEGGAHLSVVGLTRGGVELDGGKLLETEHFLSGAPSVLFDAVTVVPGPDSGDELAANPSAIQWVQDAFHHCKAIGHTLAAGALLERAGLARRAESDPAVVALEKGGVDAFVEQASRHRRWAREVETDAS